MVETGNLVMVVVWGVLAILYFLPSIVALKRDHHQTTAIFVLTLLAGWTLIGWVGALVVPGRNNSSLYTVNGRPLYVHLNGLAIVLLK
jgi:hypothetical protein